MKVLEGPAAGSAPKATRRDMVKKKRKSRKGKRARPELTGAQVTWARGLGKIDKRDRPYPPGPGVIPAREEVE